MKDGQKITFRGESNAVSVEEKGWEGGKVVGFKSAGAIILTALVITLVHL